MMHNNLPKLEQQTSLHEDLKHLIKSIVPSKTPLLITPSAFIENLKTHLEARKSFHTKEVLAEAEELLEILEQARAQHTAQALHSSAKIMPKAVEYCDQDLLWAASKNDISLVKTLLEHSVDVNVQGHLGVTPLHYAVSFGNLNLISLLVDHGADASIKAYSQADISTGINALELAIGNHQIDVAHYLIEHHQFDSQSYFEIFSIAIELNQAELLELLINNEAHRTLSADQLDELVLAQTLQFVEYIFDPSVSHTFAHLQSMMNVLMPLLELTGTMCSLMDYPDYQDSPPIGTFFELFATAIEDPTLHRFLKDSAETIKSLDNHHDTYVMAKSLFHLIPIDGTYTVNFEGRTEDSFKPTFMNAEGFYHLYTVPLLERGLSHYLEQKDIQSPSLLHAFESSLSTVQLTSQLIDRAALMSSAEQLYSEYHQGHTVLLPTGWDGHAVDVLLNKDLGLLIIANQGERHKDFQSGVNIFQMHNLDCVTPELFHQLLMNEEQSFLEFKLSMALGLEPIDVIQEPNQFTGNCAWQSQESAMEGLLYINLLTEGLSHEEAKDLAHQSYLEWDVFQTNDFIQSYFTKTPPFEIDAMEALIRTQAYQVGTKDLDILKQDSTGALLIQYYEDHFGNDPALINLDYDPFHFEDLFDFVDILENRIELEKTLPPEDMDTLFYQPPSSLDIESLPVPEAF